MNDRPNYIHLDLKGMCPDEPGFLTWIDRFAAAGFNGIVFEYEDRFPWRIWPGAFRPGYDRDAWQRIWQRCRERSLSIVPLIQVQGHLGWLLRHEAYAPLREDGHVSEGCPQNPAFVEGVTRWIDELIELHPDAPLIHLGADETYFLASCPACRKKAEVHGHKLGVFVEHIGQLARHVLDRGRHPMIWGDAFWHDATWAAKLPKDLILVDWQYGWLGATQITIRDVPQEVWASDAVRCAYNLQYLLAPLEQRMRNLAIWQPQLADGRIPGLIHTTWSRHDSHGLLYGPFEGWWPVFVAAGDPQRGATHPLRALLPLVDAAMHPRPGETEELGFKPDLARFRDHEDEMTRRCAAWWELAIEHAALVRRVTGIALYRRSLLPTIAQMGSDDRHDANLDRAAANTRAELASVRQRIACLLAEWRVSDADEFLAGRIDALIPCLSADGSVEPSRAIRRHV